VDEHQSSIGERKGMPLLLKEPMIIGYSDDVLLLVEAADVGNGEALAQVWSAQMGYSGLWQLQVLRATLRFEAVDPAESLLDQLIGGDEV
jgi:hypothetical protein